MGKQFWVSAESFLGMVQAVCTIRDEGRGIRD